MNIPAGNTATIGASTPGTWTLTITNTYNGCTSTSTVEVDQDTNAPVLSMVPSAAGLNCDIQTITYDATGSSVSTGNLIYEWTDVTNGTILGNTATLDISNTNEVILTITDDGNGCSTTQSYIATQDIEEPNASAGFPQTLFCGDTEVTLDGSASDAGGDAFTYNWTDPMGDPGGTTAQVAASITGSWELLITNTVNGCTSIETVEVDQNIEAPTAVVDFAGMLTCDVNEITVDGSASSTASGSALLYEWEGGTASPTASFDAPGTYTLIITDVLNNCTATQSFTIEEDVLPPVADIQALTSSTISCTEPTLEFNGAASNNNGNPNGGTLTYEWTLNGNVVSTATPDQVEISEPGDLVLEVTNTNNGCVSTFLLSVDVNDDVPICNIPTAPQPLTCIVDEVTIVANGSTGPEYTYLWTTTNGTIVSGETTLAPVVSEIGTYTLTVTNTISGCDVSISAVVSGDFDEPIAVANVTDQFDCITDEITLDATGSATGSTITYSWTTATGVIESGSNTVNPVVSTPGEYTLEVTDTGNGCTSTAIVNVSGNIDVPTVEGFQVIDPNCFGESNGSIILDNVTGGELPYLYSIDGSALGSNNQFSFLPAGQYDILVEDANGCTVSQVITITDPQKLSVELGDNQIIGLGDDFQLSAQIVGAYDTIMWSANCPDSVCANQPQFSISPLNTVSYNVTVVDGNGCITFDQITITVEKGREVYIPNAFSPNDDGYNDRFWVYPGKEVAKIHEFRVFNRWGEEVFGISDYDPFVQNNTNGWDGFLDNKKMNPAVFVYYVDVEYIDGRREVLKGDVTLRP
jgi:gliding motility-associated-like protein